MGYWISCIRSAIHPRHTEAIKPHDGPTRKSARSIRDVSSRGGHHGKLYNEGIIGLELMFGGLVIGSVIGILMATRVEMTGMPELVALFNGFGGGASALVALSEVLKRIETNEIPLEGTVELYATWIAIGLSGLVGWLTLTGSLMAMGKLRGGFYIPFTKKDDRGRSKWVSFPTWGPPWLNSVKSILLIAGISLIWLSINDPTNKDFVYALVATSSILGILFVIPIGGADMPVVVSLLNSMSGIAAAFTGFVIGIMSHHCRLYGWRCWPYFDIHNVQSDEPNINRGFIQIVWRWWEGIGH